MASGLEVGSLVGFIAGAGIVTLLTYILGEETMLNWGWRVPFLIAAPIGFIGFYLRNNLEETPAFEKEKQEKERHVSMKDLFVYHRKALLIATILVFFYNVVYYTVLTYTPTHLSAVLGYGETKGLLLILIVMFIMIPIVLMMGYFGDRIGNKRVVQGGLIGLIILAIPSFLLIESGNTWFVFLGLMILAVFLGSFQGTMPSLLPSLFFTEVRYGSLAVTYNVSTSLFGGTAPLLIAWLINVTTSLLIPAYYITFVCLIGIFVVTYFVKNTSGKPLRGSPPAVADEDKVEEVIEDHGDVLWWEEEKNEIDEKKEEPGQQK